VSVEPLAFERIVRATQKLDVPSCSFTTDSIRLIMMELDKGSLVAPPSALTHERAPTAVAQVDRTTDLGRDVAAAGSRAPAGPWPVRYRVFLPAEIFDQQLERPLDGLCRITVGKRVSEQVLRLPQVLSSFTAYRDPNFVALGSERCDNRGPRRGWRNNQHGQRRSGQLAD